MPAAIKENSNIIATAAEQLTALSSPSIRLVYSKAGDTNNPIYFQQKGRGQFSLARKIMDKFELEDVFNVLIDAFESVHPVKSSFKQREQIFKLTKQKLLQRNKLVDSMELDIQKLRAELPTCAPILFRSAENETKDPFDFVKLHYGKWVYKANSDVPNLVFTRSVLMHLDQKLMFKIENEIRKFKRNGSGPPEWFDLPTKEEAIDRQLIYLSLSSQNPNEIARLALAKARRMPLRQVGTAPV